MAKVMAHSLLGNNTSGSSSVVFPVTCHEKLWLVSNEIQVIYIREKRKMGSHYNHRIELEKLFLYF